MRRVCFEIAVIAPSYICSGVKRAIFDGFYGILSIFYVIFGTCLR